jgi:DNA-binding NarL/FixJ family response regulator
LVDVAFEAGAVDLVVTSYRASPDLLSALLRDSETAERAGYIVARASDEELATSIGVDVLGAIDPASTLSVREREVYDLLCEGLTNAQIAKRLFIEPSTVKVHVHHVFDKVGIRSRTALVINAASRRPQATPAILSDSASSVSEG